MTSSSKKIIVVLGMHRSGTSAITRGLPLLGADLGNDLMPAVPGDNDKGFWEDTGIYALNERILEKLNSSWDALADLSETDLTSDALEEERREASTLLRSRTENVDLFAFKDPRTANLLPFWQSVFNEIGLEDHYLLVIRNPKSVADSLAVRNEFAREKSLALWMKHNCNAVSSMGERPFSVVDFDQFLEQPLENLQRIAGDLNLPQPDAASAACEEYLGEFLSTNLRHSKYDEVLDERSIFPAYVARAYEELRSKAAEGVQSLKTGPCAEHQLLSPLFPYVDKLNVEQRELTQRLGGLQSQHLKLERLLEDREREFEDREREFESREDEFKGTLADIYSKLRCFDRSAVGRVFKTVESVYKYLRFKPRSETLYAQLNEEARNYLENNNIDYSQLADQHQGRLRLLAKIAAYVIRHPYSSFRLLSVYRIKKLFGMVFKADPGVAEGWVSERFPADYKSKYRPTLFPITKDLDEVELPFLHFESPKVSIVVPVYNEYRTTISCLQALLANTDGVPYEVIIADDCSTDLTTSIESRIENVQVVRGEVNLGFLGNCNAGAAVARGEFIVFLNNDTNVQEGWLSSLVDLIERDESIGLVGPKLLFDDGVLQEAGGIVWRDGSGWNYGRGQGPGRPEYNYVRETDYISGACILLRNSTWKKLGGFDTRFAPAYYEDTDLAFQVRDLGLKVMYQPESVVVHFEGVSNGTDLTSGIKENQAKNQKVFRAKWADQLDARHYPNGDSVFKARDRAASRKTVVVIDHYVPFYDKDAGSRSTYIYLKEMVGCGLNVKFMPANFFPHQPYTRDLQQLGIEVLYGEDYARDWKRWFRSNKNYIDVVYLHRPHVTEQFIDHLTNLRPKPKVIYFGHDLHYLRAKREHELLGENPAGSDEEDWRAREIDIFHKSDMVYYPSFVEVEEVRRVAPQTNVRSIPLYFLSEPDVETYKHQDRQDLLFVGGFGHPPNVDGVLWFVNEVLPIIHDAFPQLRLHIVGSGVPDEISKLSSERICIHGYLSDDDLANLYRQVRVSVVPLRYGAGVKGKVLEALQAGVPICTTNIGAEGLPNPNDVMALADHADDFAAQVVALYGDSYLCEAYLDRYSDYIRKYFSRSAVRNVINQDFC